MALKLDNSPVCPDAIGAANTSLTCAVILSKLNKYSESIEQAQVCMRAIEENAGIDKNAPLSQYKQHLLRDGGQQNGGRLQDQDKIMTTYSICLHLLGKNLANLKYFKESKVFLQRAQYVALNLTTTPKPDLVTAINNDIKNINVSCINSKAYQTNFKRALGDPTAPAKDDTNILDEETETALNSIKANVASSTYNMAADFQEQKALVGQLIQQHHQKKADEMKEDDKALEYVKEYIEEKKRKEQVAIDEYRSKI